MQPIGKHILVFDSGIGGLSIVEHLRKTLGDIQITYLADNQCFPYGLLEESQLIKRVVTLITKVIEQYQPDLVVIACNTASTLALPSVRKAIDIPVVGVVPAIKPAAELSHSKVIGLLATPGTIQRDYTDELIANFAPHCEVIRVGSTQLVQLVEDNFQGVDYPLNTLVDILQPFTRHIGWESLDTIVLACTHFPLAKKELSQACPNIIHWIDSGEAIARRVANLLQEQQTTGHQLHPSIALFTQIATLNSLYLARLTTFGFQKTAEMTR